MDLNSLRHFLVAADCLHFGEAAERLNIAQPALSQRIKALEERLGVRLFHRARRSVQLTDAGRVLVQRARQLIEEADRAVRLTRAAGQGAAGDLHVGYGGSVIFEPRICALIETFSQAYPDISLHLHECTVKEQLERVSSGNLDVALLWGPVGPTFTGLQSLLFCRASMAVVLARDHQLAERAELRLEDMQSESFISLMDPPGTGIGHVVDGLFETAKVSPRIVIRVSSLISVMGLAGAGLGIGIVPALPIDINSPAFVHRPLIGSGDCNEILIVTQRQSSSRLAQNFTAMADAQMDRC